MSSHLEYYSANTIMMIRQKMHSILVSLARLSTYLGRLSKRFFFFNALIEHIVKLSEDSALTEIGFELLLATL